MTIREQVKDKRVLIWGYGREGKSSEKYLNEYCECKTVSVFEGKVEEINRNEYDIILKSPGIILDDDDPIFSSQTELFLEEFGAQVIGITGTKGKSTTSAMMAHVLEACTGRPVILLGNIGLPCFDYCSEIASDTIIVFEMSCHQLKHNQVSPHVGIFLNLFEEHLDYYGTMEAYFKAKSNVAAHMSTNDYYFCGENVPGFETAAKKKVITKADIVPVSLRIYGEHNMLNAAFVRVVAKEVYSCEDDAIDLAMMDFQGLPHRLQSIGKYVGINWYDDSISTIPEAAISAIESLPNIKTILIGGMDRGISYDILVKYMTENKSVQYICMYESGDRILNELTAYLAEKGQKLPGYIYRVPDLESAVHLAADITPEGMGCVLSPAAASYGYFKNFEERGEVFAGYVKEIVLD